MLRLQLHTPPKIKEAAVLSGIAEYEKRLGRFCRLKISSSTFKSWKSCHSNCFIANTSERPLVVFTTGKGTLSSEGLADLFAQLALVGHSDLDLVIDLDPSIVTWPVDPAPTAPIHLIPLTAAIADKELFSLLVVEQIYRAFKIQAGEAYHK